MVKFQSRKSTHKRQRQYFEQKKRQQHSNGDDDAEGTHGSAEYHRTPKSLDILSLLNLAGEAKGGNSGCNNADGPALRVSPLNYQVPKDMHCGQLEEIGFMDCMSIDEVALGNVMSVRFLSVAGTRNTKWSSALHLWNLLPNLICLDVSRTDVTSAVVVRLMSTTPSLKVVCALNCPNLEEESNHTAYKVKGKLLLPLFSDIFKGVASLFADTTVKDRDAFSEWSSSKSGNKNLNDTMTWLEWILSHTLLRIAETNPQGLDTFWLKQGDALLLSLMRSSQVDVQERAATGLATFVVIDDENATVDCGRAEAVMQDGGIRLLLDLAKSCREGLQSEAAKAIANLSVNAKVAKAVAEGGGINILADLARSMNRLVAEEAAGGLWNLSVGEEHKGAIGEAG
ncbi:hypothetical protein MKW98_027898 [Papaver atlanticum]|uniref:Uncharacterized protein n=1 Tax=Papaver atlanticum TaxID=357466 RepID=A0AAD4SA63_9MAGN|nr:hypothetical protein MKW98_027898 [Papaver atlanticum]